MSDNLSLHLWTEDMEWDLRVSRLRSGASPHQSPWSFLSRYQPNDASPSGLLLPPDYGANTSYAHYVSLSGNIYQTMGGGVVFPPAGHTLTSNSTYWPLSTSAAPYLPIVNWNAISFIPSSGVVEKPTEPEPLTKTAPIVGFRAWHTDGQALMLASTNAYYLWYPLEDLQAQCMYHPAHEAPVWDCYCGFYLRSTLGRVRDGGFALGAGVVGAVLGWGKVVVHRQGEQITGYRCEYARPLALLDTRLFGEDQNLEELSKIYQIPILGRRALLEYVREFGEVAE